MKVLTKEKIINYTLPEVWLKWTTEEGMKSFLVENCRIDLQIGGPFELYFLSDAPEGMKGSEGCKILSFIPKKMFSFSWNAPPSIPSIRDLGDVAWVVVEFEEMGPEQTLIRLQHLGFGEGEEWNKTYEYFEEAWDYVFNALHQDALNKHS